jgi:hypothetical protein
MKANVGNVDRIVRVILGLVLLFLGIFALHAGAWKWILIILGLIGLGTGLSGSCLLYLPFGISTRKAKS